MKDYMGLSSTKLAYVPLIPATMKDHMGQSWAKPAYVPMAIYYHAWKIDAYIPISEFLGLRLRF